MRTLVLSIMILALNSNFASARIILTATSCPEDEYVVLVTNEKSGFGDEGICLPKDQAPFQIKFDDGRVEMIDTKIEYEQRREQLLNSIKG